MTNLGTPSANEQRLSINKRVTTPPQPLTDARRATLLRIADLLIPEVGENPRASDSPDYNKWLDLAIAARRESVDDLFAVLDEAANLDEAALDQFLRRMADGPDELGRDDPGGPAAHDEDAARRQPTDTDAAQHGAERFHLVSGIVAGAYFMTPENMARVGYPGQRREVPGPTEAADDLDGDILDPVVERGPIYLSVCGE